MDTVLFTYELGGGFGHLNRLISVAGAMPHVDRTVFALPHRRVGSDAVKRALGDEAEVIEGVSWSNPSDAAKARQVPTHSLADVLMLFGLSERDQIARAVDKWRRISCR